MDKKGYITSATTNYYKMSGIDEIMRSFDELDNAMKKHLRKVDPLLIIDLIFRQKAGKHNPIYTLEVFIKPGQNTDEIRNNIIQQTGKAPAFYDEGTHIVVADRINFEVLKMINDFDLVERIRGTYAGSMASIGPVYER